MPLPKAYLFLQLLDKIKMQWNYCMCSREKIEKNIKYTTRESSQSFLLSGEPRLFIQNSFDICKKYNAVLKLYWTRHIVNTWVKAAI